MEFMMLAQFFPSGGIRGVEQLPVFGDAVDVYRDAVGASFHEEIIFKRVSSTRGRAYSWFLPGDIVCHRLGLHENRCDVLRPLSDKVFIAGNVDASTFDGEVEALRCSAIEGHKWEVGRGDDWLSVIDPQGRALVIAHQYAGQQWPKVMEKLVYRRNRIVEERAPWKRQGAAWCALRGVHGYFMNEHQGEMTMADVVKSDRYVHDIFKRRMELMHLSGTGRIVKMRKMRAKMYGPFWDRCFRMMDNGEPVADVVRHVRDHFCTRWVAVSVKDLEWLLCCMGWPEWVGYGPVTFEKFKRGSYGGRMWK